MHSLPPLLAVVLAVLIHVFLHHYTSPPHPERYSAPQTSPPLISNKCEPLHRFRLRPRPLGYTCIRQIQASATELTLQIRLPRPGNFTIYLQVAGVPSDPIASTFVSIPTLNRTQTLLYNAEGLQSDTSYVAVVEQRTTVCRIPVFTLPDNNLVQNPSFETAAKPLFLATSFHQQKTPRAWTPFYNGGAVRFCGPFSDPADRIFVQIPRSGECFLLLGPDIRSPLYGFHKQNEFYYGVHQSVRIWKPSNLIVGHAWYSTSSAVRGAKQHPCKSCADSLSLVISVITEDGHWHDGATIPLDHSIDWTKVCAQVQSAKPISSIHIFFHFHDHSRGHVFVDDVGVSDVNISEAVEQANCYQIEIGSPPIQKQTPILRHLVAAVRPKTSQLTVAVPLTHDRVLRLEAMSRLYGGGPVVAAVLVRSESEARIFERIWRKKPWLRNYVDVGFVKRAADEPALPINALRNVAIRLTETEFVLMLDVDMTPATISFECFRNDSGKHLSILLPEDVRRIAVFPVFITQSHHRPARDKEELLDQLNSGVGTIYCANSQKPNRIKRWYTTTEAVETFFTKDYEPYGIARRNLYPMYDERFSGYGFNKISWAVAAARWGYSFLVLEDAFVTHLNHVENSWVSDINVSHYLTTWRRFFGFVAEEGSDTDLEQRL
ncbi:unnamed protein product [Agarophyton chilense]|eukprot:gb/GEZJ01004856.1/.p1 GENE.gb/GEZJ01004856.1/~~gb/GEZJ01004856.1/.p1  ORF type:complete len:661 (-),score=45.12 gb/GEZJ01004856.1/:1337-3319(-)